jgi:hypothetical protein
VVSAWPEPPSARPAAPSADRTERKRATELASIHHKSDASPQDCKDAGHRVSAQGARPRRRGDRIELPSLHCICRLVAQSGLSAMSVSLSAFGGLCCKTILSMWARNIDSRSRTAKQLRFKSALVPIRLFQNPIPQLLYGDFCNTIGVKRTCRDPGRSIHSTRMIQCGHRWDQNPAARQSVR